MACDSGAGAGAGVAGRAGGRLFALACLLVVAFAAPAASEAAIQRDPIGVNVSASRPMSLTVRFASTDGTRFTSDQALFCYRQLPDGRCDPGAMLGRLSRSRDRGSTSTPTTRITDVMTIPYSVIRSTLAIAQDVDFSDFYYVRRFVPEAGGDLGAGPDQPVYQKVTCHLAGPARVPLSLTRVQLSAREAGRDGPQKLVRLDADNLSSGQVFAEIEYTGTGFIEGWWEVRQPGEQPLSASDRLPRAALPADQRALQRRYRRVKRFRAQATTAGLVRLAGPTYAELPRSLSGRHELLLRVAAGRGRENRARLAVDGEPLNLFSGGVAGFALPHLEYHVPTGLAARPGAADEAAATLYRLPREQGGGWRLVWRDVRERASVLRLTVGEAPALLLPAAARDVGLPSALAEALPDAPAQLVLLDAAGQSLGSLSLRVQP